MMCSLVASCRLMSCYDINVPFLDCFLLAYLLVRIRECAVVMASIQSELHPQRLWCWRLGLKSMSSSIINQSVRAFMSGSTCLRHGLYLWFDIADTTRPYRPRWSLPLRRSRPAWPTSSNRPPRRSRPPLPGRRSVLGPRRRRCPTWSIRPTHHPRCQRQ